MSKTCLHCHQEITRGPFDSDGAWKQRKIHRHCKAARKKAQEKERDKARRKPAICKECHKPMIRQKGERNSTWYRRTMHKKCRSAFHLRQYKETVRGPMFDTTQIKSSDFIQGLLMERW